MATIRLPCYGPDGKQCTTFSMSTQASTKANKGLFAKGKPAGLFFPHVDGKVRLPRAGETWHLVEGPKDAAALYNLGVLAAGLPSSSMKVKFAKLFIGVDVIVVPDRDEAGERGAAKSCAYLYGVAASLRIATLPAEYRRSKGDDVRDVLKRQDGREHVLQAVADARPWQPTDDNHSVGDNGAGTSGVDSLPEAVLPGGPRRVTDSAEHLGQLLAATDSHFFRGGTIVKLVLDEYGARRLKPLKPAAMPAVFETVARLLKVVVKDEVPELVPTTCNEQTAKILLHSEPFQQALPPINILARCPVFIERNGILTLVSGYDWESGILADGGTMRTVSLDDARNLLHELVADFRFATQGDRSRALAALITPALVFGGLLQGRAPIDLSEADQSQAGKGFRNKLTAAIYREMVKTVTQRRGGVGSLEETFNAAVISGAPFIALDNIRGKIDSPSIESFLTEDRYFARIPYAPATEIDPRRTVLMITSNKAEVTPDLANRSSCVRILKQPTGYNFREYPEGDVLDHIKANQPLYLGAVYVIVKAWFDQGQPTTKESRHDFRRWARVLDWIVQHLLLGAPIMEGHRQTQQRMTNPALTWLRQLALTVELTGKTDQ